MYIYRRASQVVLMVKNPPANAGDIRDAGSIYGLGIIPWRRAWQTTLVGSAWRIPWTDESSRIQSIGSQRVGHD